MADSAPCDGNAPGPRWARALWVWLLICAVSAQAAPGANPVDAGSSFDQANKLYEQGKFTEAAAGYEAIARAGAVSPALYFNLANAWLKSGQLGRAILNYRRAGQLAPRDPDVRANLQLARGRANAGAGLAPRWLAWADALSLDELSLLSAAMLWIWFGLLALTEVLPGARQAVRSAISAAAILTVFFGCWLGRSWYAQIAVRPAVVVGREAVVRLGPFDESQSAFVLHDGAEVQTRHRKGDWLEIRDAGGRRGWVRQDQLERVNAS